MAKQSENLEEPPERENFRADPEILRLWFTFVSILIPAVILLGLVFVGWAFLWLPQLVEKKENSKATPVTEAVLSDSENVDRLVAESTKILEKIYYQELSKQTTSITELLSIADQIDEIASRTGNDFAGLPQIVRLKILSAWDRIRFENSLAEPRHDLDVRRYAIRLISDEQPEIAKLAHFSLVLSFSYELAVSRTNQLLKEFNTHATQVAQYYLNDQLKMMQLSKAIKAVALSDKGENINYQAMLHWFGDKYSASTNEAVRQIGVELHDLALTGTLDFRELLDKISNGDESAISQAKAFVAATNITSMYSEAIFYRGIQIADAFEMNGQADESNKLVVQLEEALSHQSDSVRQIAGKYIEDYHRRSRLVGMPFELVANKFDGTAFDFSDYQDKAVVIVFLRRLDNPSLNVMEDVFAMKNFFKNGIRFVCPILKEVKDVRVRDGESVESVDQFRLFGRMIEEFTHVRFPDGSGSPRLLEQCPILTAPCVLLLNPDHEVVGCNMAMRDVRAIIEASDWQN